MGTKIFTLMFCLAFSTFLISSFTYAGPMASTATSPVRTLVEWTGADAPGMEAVDVEVRVLAGGRLGLRAKAEAGRSGIILKTGKPPWNLEGLAQVAVAVRNTGTTPVRVMLRVDDAKTLKLPIERFSLGHCARMIEPGGEPVWLSVALADKEYKERFVGMQINPPDLSPGTVNESGVTQVTLMMLETGKGERAIEIGPVVARGTAQHLRKADEGFPFIDRFGQYMHRDWPDKIKEEKEFARRLEAEEKDLAAHARPAGWNQYGGWLDGPQHKATGFFRVEKINGTWWMIDPEGRRFWSHGAVRVGTRVRVGSVYRGTPITDREHYFDLPPREGKFGQFYDTEPQATRGYYVGKEGHAVYDFLEANLYRKYGAEWAKLYGEMAQRRLASWGLNTIANSSDPQIYSMRRTPYTAIVYSVPLGRSDHTIAGAQQSWVKFPDPFDPGFQEGMAKTLQTTLQTALNDPWCLGFFVDNEMGFGDSCALAEAALASPASQHAKVAFIGDLKKKYGGIEKLNAAWGTKHADWQALAGASAKPDRKRAAVKADLEAFTERILDGYFRSCREAIKTASPGHLYMGCRFAGGGSEQVMRIAAKYCDVISINRYSQEIGELSLPAGLDRPIIIGEFSFGALDRGKFRANNVPVIDQTERAAAYRRYVESALRNPAVIGTHWFQFYDQPTTARFDGENMQHGLIDICDTPYRETIAAVREMGATIYKIRAGGRP